MVRKLQKRVKAKPTFILVLAFVSILGFLANSIVAFTGLELSPWILPLTSMILGLGLLIEGNVRQVLKIRRQIDAEAIVHIVTVVTGALVFVSGFLTLPFIGVEPTGVIGTIIGFANLIAGIVVAVEVFLVE